MKRSLNDTLKTKAKPTKGKTTYRCFESVNTPTVRSWEVYYKENMQYHKPDPRAFAHIEELHGLKPEECVYVGDQPGDAAAAKGAGLFFIANLEEGIRTREDFTEFAVDDFVDTFAGVPTAISQLNARLQNKSKG